MKDFKPILEEFGATIEANPNITDAELLHKFPEFENNVETLTSAYSYYHTRKSNKYKTIEEVDAKFPEFFGELTNDQVKQETKLGYKTTQPLGKIDQVDIKLKPYGANKSTNLFGGEAQPTAFDLTSQRVRENQKAENEELISTGAIYKKMQEADERGDDAELKRLLKLSDEHNAKMVEAIDKKIAELESREGSLYKTETLNNWKNLREVYKAPSTYKPQTLTDNFATRFFQGSVDKVGYETIPFVGGALDVTLLSTAAHLIRKMNKGEKLTPEEEEYAISAMALFSPTREDISWAYSAGEGFTDMIPIGAEIAVAAGTFGASGGATGGIQATKQLLKKGLKEGIEWYLKKHGISSAKDFVVKGTKGAAKSTGKFLGTSAMNTSIWGQNVGQDNLSRALDNQNYTLENLGTSLLNSMQSTAIEKWGGGLFDPLATKFLKYGGRVATFMKRAGVNSIVGEGGEEALEAVSNLLRGETGVLAGDARSQKELRESGKEFFTPKGIATTLGATLIPSLLGAGGSAIDFQMQKRKFNSSRRDIEKLLQDNAVDDNTKQEISDLLNGLKSELKSEEILGITNHIGNILQKEGVSAEDFNKIRKPIAEYLNARKVMDDYLFKMDENYNNLSPEEQQKVDEILSEEIEKIEVQKEISRLIDVFSLETHEDENGQEHNFTREELIKLDEMYRSHPENLSLFQQQVAHGLNRFVAKGIQERTAKKNLPFQTNKTTGKVQEVTLSNGEKAYIRKGNLAMTEDGTIDKDNSDNEIVVALADGTLKNISTESNSGLSIVSLDSEMSAEEHLAIESETYDMGEVLFENPLNGEYLVIGKKNPDGTYQVEQRDANGNIINVTNETKRAIFETKKSKINEKVQEGVNDIVNVANNGEEYILDVNGEKHEVVVARNEDGTYLIVDEQGAKQTYAPEVFNGMVNDKILTKKTPEQSSQDNGSNNQPLSVEGQQNTPLSAEDQLKQDIADAEEMESLGDTEYLESNLAEAEKKLAEIAKKKPTALGKEERLAELKAINEEKAQAEAEVNRWRSAKEGLAQKKAQAEQVETPQTQTPVENKEESNDDRTQFRWVADSITDLKDIEGARIELNNKYIPRIKRAEANGNIQEMLTLQAKYAMEAQAIIEKQNALQLEKKRTWAEKAKQTLGVEIEMIEDPNEIPSEEKAALKAINDGKRVKGWYNPDTGGTYLYVPNIDSIGDAKKTIFHELVAHKGIKEIFKGENFDKLLDKVWNKMNKAEQDKYLKYAYMKKKGEELTDKERQDIGKRREAADEYIAHLAEKGIENTSTWQTIKNWLREVLRSLGIDMKLTDAEIKDIINRSYENIQKGEMTSTDSKRAEIENKFKEGEAKGAMFLISNTPEEFDAIQKEAVEKRGIVMPNLADKSVSIVKYEGEERIPHELRKKDIKEWAVKNVTDNNAYIIDSDGNKHNCPITAKAIGKYVDYSASDKSVSEEVHLLAMPLLSKILANSIEVEVHPDYKKKDENRSHKNGYNPAVLIHRFYGAVEIDGVVYRTKSTIKEYRDKNTSLKPYSYEVTKIELLPNSTPDANDAHGNPLSVGNNSISATKLLQRVEKSYDKGKKVLIESEKQSIKEKAIADGTFMKAPNGKPTNLTEDQWLNVRTQNFKRWFGDWENDPANASKVVDENGEPMVVYHGTKSGVFTIFDTDGQGKTRDTGAFFAEREKDAMSYSQSGYYFNNEDFEIADEWGTDNSKGNYAVFLNIRNPYVQDFYDNSWDDIWGQKWMVINEEGDVVERFAYEEKAQEYIDNAENSDGLQIEEDYYSETIDDFVRDVRKGYMSDVPNDGVYAKNIYDGGSEMAFANEWVVFSPNQIKSATDNNGEYSNENNDIRFRVTEAEDQAYLDAVAKGDMETAQRMVDEVAKKAMPNTQVVDGADNPLLMSHHTDAQGFYTFDKEKIGTGQGQAFLGAGFNFSKGLGSDVYGKRSIQAYLDAQHPLRSDKNTINKSEIRSILDELNTMSEDKIELSWGSMRDAVNTLSEYSDLDIYATLCMTYSGATTDVMEVFAKRGYDSTIEYNDNGEIINAVVFESSQIKSADPVTYDDNGNVIPLSERFNKKKDDIRFRITPEEAKRRADEIKSLNPIDIEENHKTKEELYKVYNELNGVEKEGNIIEFYNTAFKKIYKGGGLFAQIIPQLDNILEQSVLAYSEEDNLGGVVRPDGTIHKEHPNVKQYHNYVGKVTINGKEYYVRTTVKEENSGASGTHAFMVTEVSLYDNTTKGLTLPITTRAKNFFDGKVDTKLQQFFEYAKKGEENSKGIRFRIDNENQEIFVSNAEKAVENIKQEKATPQQWLAMIEKNGGLKAGEDKWLGLSDWLKEKANEKVEMQEGETMGEYAKRVAKAKTITKQEILDFIAENKIQIEEVKYGDVEDESQFKELQQEFKDLYYEFDHNGERAWEEMVERHGEDFSLAFSYYGDTLEANTDYGNDAVEYFLNTRGINETRRKYTTDGLTNKQEIALVVPTIESWNESDEIHFGDAGGGRAVAWVRFGETTIYDEVDDVQEVTEFHEPYKDVNGRDIYKPIGSFSKKDFIVHGKTPNGSMIYVVYINEKQIPVAHQSLEDARMAMNEYYKEHPRKLRKPISVLVIDEIQSKRHQDARDVFERKMTEKYGEDWKDKVTQEEREIGGYRLSYEEIKDEMQAFQWEMEEKYGSVPYSATQLEKMGATPEEVAQMQRYDDVVSGKGIPSAPFEKNWHELAMKRMLRYAAENGFDKVAWTTGEQQAERYNMRKLFNDIEREDNPNIEGKRFVLSGANTETFQVNDNGIVTDSTIEEAKGKPLAEVVGKDMSVKMMSLENGDLLEGEDLKIGGEGMKGFYDKMLPSFMNKYVKKWGTKVGEVTMPQLEEGYQTMHSVDVTPEMKESVMQGQTMFKIDRDWDFNSGYTQRDNGDRISVRASEAEADGTFTEGTFRKQYGVSKKAFELLRKLGVIKKTEWHHTGANFKESDYFSWADSYRNGGHTSYEDAITEEGSLGDIYKANKKQIDNLIKEFENAEWQYKLPKTLAHVPSIEGYMWDNVILNDEEREKADKLHEEISRGGSAIGSSFDRYQMHSGVDEKMKRKAIERSKEELQERYNERYGSIIESNKLKEDYNNTIDELNAKTDGKESILNQIADIFGVDAKSSITYNSQSEQKRIAREKRIEEAKEMKSAHEKQEAEMRKALDKWVADQKKKGGIKDVERIKESQKPPYFITTKEEMNGKYGWFEASWRYNLPVYVSGMEFSSKRLLDSYRNRLNNIGETIRNNDNEYRAFVNQDEGTLFRIEDVKDDTRFRIGDISNVAQYDKENGTELGAWLDFVENGTIAPNKRQFFLGMTGDVLSRYGIKGKINVSRKAINLNRHSNDEDHKLGVQEWIDIIDTINEPVAITKYKDKSNSYRIYTIAKINGKNICVGVDVDTNNVVEITKIVTAFGRDVAKIKTATNEELVYEKEKAEEKISGSDNPHRYSQQPSTDKDTKNIPNTQEDATRFLIDEKLSNLNINFAKNETADEILERLSQAGHRTEVKENERMVEELRQSERGRGSEKTSRDAQDAQRTLSGLEEARIVEEYAKENNLWMPIEDSFKLGSALPSGNENDVYLSKDKQFVYKVNNLMNSKGKVSNLIEKVNLHNLLFPQTSYAIVGITGFEGRSIYPILQQIFIPESQPATLDEIDNYMNSLGFTKEKDYVYSNGNYVVSDLRPRNVLKDSDGDIYVIDAEIEPISQDNTRFSYSEGDEVTIGEDETLHDIIKRIAIERQYMKKEEFAKEMDSLAKKEMSNIAKLQKDWLDAFRDIERFQKWVVDNGGEVGVAQDMYNDIFRAKGRITTQTNRFRNIQIKRMAQVVGAIMRSKGIKAFDLTWQNLEDKGKVIEGKKIAPRELVGLYAQARDMVEAMELGLKDRGIDGFTKNVGMTPQEFITLFEGNIEADLIKELWASINDATNFALKYQLEGGLIDQATYDSYQNRKYYVPERGWAERTLNPDKEGYVNGSTTKGAEPYNAALKKARGRVSLADDPFAFIQSIGESAIISTEKNKSKQKMLDLVLANEELGLKTGGFYVRKAWLVNTINELDGTITTTITYKKPTAEQFKKDEEIKAEIREKQKEKYARIQHLKKLQSQKPTTTIEEAIAIAQENIKSLDAEIEALNKQILIAGSVNDSRISNRTKTEIEQHGVLVMKDGQQYVIEFKNEQLANAINNNFDKAYSSWQNTIGRAAVSAKNYITASITQYNPAFAAVNFIRDFGVGVVGNSIEHGALFTAKFMKNIAVSQRAVVNYVFNEKFRDKESFVNSDMGRYLKEFFEEGAETGFSFLQELNVLRKDFDAMTKKENFLKKGGKGVLSTLSALTEISELSIRFAQYVTARQLGKSQEEASTMAKEVTTNFDRKGLRSKNLNALFGFFNASVQGTYRWLKPLFVTGGKRVLAGFSAWAGVFGAIGFLATMLQPNDPDDERYLSEWERMTNLIFGKAKIPMPHFFRMFNAIGVQMALVAQNKKTLTDALISTTDFIFGEIIPQLELPIAYDDAKGEMEFDWQRTLASIIPTIANPSAEVILNRNFTGNPIKRETPFNDDVMNVQKGSGRTSDVYVNIARKLNELTGGNLEYETKRDAGWIDINPSSLEHLLSGYSPALDMVSVVGNSVYKSLNDEKVYNNELPFLRKVSTSYRPDRVYSNEYWALKEKVESLKKFSKDHLEKEDETYDDLHRRLEEINGQILKNPTKKPERDKYYQPYEIKELMELNQELMEIDEELHGSNKQQNTY